MRPLWALVIYIVFVFIGGALLAPWLYWLAQYFAHSFPGLAAKPFHRFLDRSFVILALVGVWPLLRGLGATSLRETGLVHPREQWGKLLAGLWLGSLSIIAVAGIVLVFGGRAFVHTADAYKIVWTIFSALGTAVAVATLEEILFRGGIFGGLRRVLFWPAALVLSSLIYALVHFFQRAELVGKVDWHSGLELLPRMLAGLVDVPTLIPGFFSLTLAGLLLGFAYQRTGNLYYSIGLHGGWIFWLKTYGALTVDLPKVSGWFWGTGKMLDGWLAFLMLAFVLLLAVSDRLPILRRHPTFLTV